MTSLISKYKKQLMAIAMIWICFDRSYVSFKFKPLNFLLVTCGYGGVDLFMFLSGFGLYFALKKETNYLNFIKKRLIRILPYNIIVCAVQMFTYNRTIFETIVTGLGLNILFIKSLFGWYTSFILFVYLLTPLYVKIFNTKPGLATFAGIIIVSLLCLLINDYEFTYMFFRLTTYFLGLYFAYRYDKGLKIKEYIWIVLSIFGWAFMYYMYHFMGNGVQHVYPMIFIAPGSLIILSHFLDKTKIFNRTLDFMGNYTYQFYLLQGTVIDYLYKIYGRLYFKVPVIGFDWFINIVGVIIAFILAVLLMNIVNFVINRIKYTSNIKQVSN